MASTSNGDGTVADITVQILRDIRDEIRTTNSRLDQTNTRLESLREEMHVGFDVLREEMHVGFDVLREEMHAGVADLRGEMHAGFDVLGKRIDNLLTGEHGREHAELRERVVRLEERVGLHAAGP